MNPQGRNLAINTQGEDVQHLHRELTLLGFNIAEDELQRVSLDHDSPRIEEMR